MTSIAFINELNNEFNQQSNLIIAKNQKAYMRHQFVFYGLTAYLRREVQTPLLKKYNLLPINKYDQLIKYLYKKERDWVIDFIQKTNLSKLSQKEVLKFISSTK